MFTVVKTLKHLICHFQYKTDKTLMVYSYFVQAILKEIDFIAKYTHNVITNNVITNTFLNIVN